MSILSHGGGIVTLISVQAWVFGDEKILLFNDIVIQCMRQVLYYSGYAWYYIKVHTPGDYVYIYEGHSFIN